MACSRCGATLHLGDRYCGRCGIDIDTASGGHGAPESAVARALQECFATLDRRFEHVYRNPKGVVAVPFGTTSVFVDTEEAPNGRVSVSVRGVVLRDLPPHPDLFRFVALDAGRYLLGGLYLYPEGNTVDLDCIVRLWHDRTTPDELIEATVTAGQRSLDLADHLHPRFGGARLNPAGEEPKLWNGEALARRRDVAEALVAALDTQSTAIMGAADRVVVMFSDQVGSEEISDPVYAVTRGGLWFAGRRGHQAAPVVRQIPHGQIDRDVMHHEEAPYDYFALLLDQSGVMIQVGSPAEAYAILRARNESV